MPYNQDDKSHLTWTLDMVLENVTELWAPGFQTSDYHTTDSATSDYSGGRTKLAKILLNGNNVCMVRLELQLSTMLLTYLVADSRR